MRIRAYTNRDAPEIRRMLNSLIEYADEILPDDVKKFEELGDREKALNYCIGLNKSKNKWKTFVCEGGDGELLGFITGGIEKEIPGFRFSSYGNVEIFFVEKGFRGRGMGRDLLERMEAWFIEKECDAVKVDTWISNTAARKAYKRMGFSEIALTFVKEAGKS